MNLESTKLLVILIGEPRSTDNEDITIDAGLQLSKFMGHILIDVSSITKADPETNWYSLECLADDGIFQTLEKKKNWMRKAAKTITKASYWGKPSPLPDSIPSLSGTQMREDRDSSVLKGSFSIKAHHQNNSSGVGNNSTGGNHVNSTRFKSDSLSTSLPIHVEKIVSKVLTHLALPLNEILYPSSFHSLVEQSLNTDSRACAHCNEEIQEKVALVCKTCKIAVHSKVHINHFNPNNYF